MGGARCLRELRFQWRSRPALDESPEVCPEAADAEAVGPAHGPRPWHRPSVGIACVLLVYSVVLISAIQQGDSVTHTQLCPTLCDPMDCSPRGSSVHRILQARILEGVAISFSRGSS